MKNLLVPIDFSPITNQVVATAEEFSRAFQAKVWLLHCVREYPLYAPLEDIPLELPAHQSDWATRFPEQYQRLATTSAWLKALGIIVEPLIVTGVPADEILYVADQFQVDLIILGTHGHSAIHDMVMGSVANTVVHQSPCRTLIVPAKRSKSSSTSIPHP